MTHDPEPVSPDDIAEEREQAFWRTADRLARERRERAGREYDRAHPVPPESRHTGEDGGRHHWPQTGPDGTWPYGAPDLASSRWDPNPRCNCGCQDADGDGRSAELDELARQRNADPLTAYERGRTEARSMMDAMSGPMSASEALARVAELRIAGVGHEPGWPS